VIRGIREMYPVTMADLARALHIPDARLRCVVAGLEARGILGRDVLPDVTYLRLLRHDISFIGRRADQKRPVKRTGPGPARGEPEENADVYR